jgi:hypothetical protein
LKVLLRNAIILMAVLFLGLIYYISATSKCKPLYQQSLFIKIFLLILSFVLAFLEKDFIIIGNLAFGGRSSVSLLVLVEIIDVLIDIKNKKQP